MKQFKNDFSYVSTGEDTIHHWKGPVDSISYEENAFRNKLLDLNKRCIILADNNFIGVTQAGEVYPGLKGDRKPIIALMQAPPVSPSQFGDPCFLETYGVKYPYYTGSMLQGISSIEMVIALGNQGILGMFGAANLSLSKIEDAIRHIQRELPDGPYGFNLSHNPYDVYAERCTVELYLKGGVKVIEASGFNDLSSHLVLYRAAGLSIDEKNEIITRNHIIAKVTRKELAAKFMQPPPEAILRDLVNNRMITEKQAKFAEKIPMADDITVEADSAGQTDNQPLISLLPAVLAMRDKMQRKYNFTKQIRIGAGGGISTPSSVLGAFMMGAAYVMTGSINQSCLEAATSTYVKSALSRADMSDVVMAPSADMFEMGVKTQVLKKSTMFPMRAQKLFELYRKYNSFAEIPAMEMSNLEKQIFRKTIDEAWSDTVHYFSNEAPDALRASARDPKKRMALLFKLYLKQSLIWAFQNEGGREMDFQIWCGPSMGAFNEWVRGSYLEDPKNRSVTDVAFHLFNGAAYLFRINSLSIQGLRIPESISVYRPYNPKDDKQL